MIKNLIKTLGFKIIFFSYRNDPHKEGEPLELYCNLQENSPLPEKKIIKNEKKNENIYHRRKMLNIFLLG